MQQFKNKEKVNISIIGPKSFHGLEEVIQSFPLSHYTLKCLSLTGKCLEISREHFDIIIKQKDSSIYRDLTIMIMNHEMKAIDLITKRGMFKQKVANLIDKEHAKGKSLDKELNHINTIRKEHFEFGEREKQNRMYNSNQKQAKVELSNKRDKL